MIDAQLNDQLSLLTEDMQIHLEYRPGWNSELSLKQVFQQQRDKDLRYGFTHSGIHRDDIKITTQGLAIEQELSRGQLKRLSTTLILAQICLLKQKTAKPAILLIDDINAELDKTSLEMIVELLSGLDLQIFITSIDGLPEPLPSNKEYKMFHVEHGMIRAAKSS